MRCRRKVRSKVNQELRSMFDDIVKDGYTYCGFFERNDFCNGFECIFFPEMIKCAFASRLTFVILLKEEFHFVWIMFESMFEEHGELPLCCTVHSGYDIMKRWKRKWYLLDGLLEKCIDFFGILMIKAPDTFHLDQFIEWLDHFDQVTKWSVGAALWTFYFWLMVKGEYATCMGQPSFLDFRFFDDSHIENCLNCFGVIGIKAFFCRRYSTRPSRSTCRVTCKALWRRGRYRVPMLCCHDWLIENLSAGTGVN